MGSGTTRRWVLRAALAAVALATCLTAAPSLAGAQGPVYLPTPPTKGALYRDGQGGRYLLGGGWLYRPDLSDVGVNEGWWRNVASTDGWAPVTVPNSYNAGDYSTQSMNGYVGWYRRDFTLPANAFARYVPRRFRAWIIRFESVNYNATVWLNGHELGTHSIAFIPFEFALKHLRWHGVNRLIVRVDDRRGPADLPPGPSGGWWNFGGIQREVYLRAVQRADISQVQVRPQLGRCLTCTATIQEQALITNFTGSTQTVSLHGYYGRVRLNFGRTRIAPYSTWTAQATAKIRHPKLWSPLRPTLYNATLTLTDSRGKRIGTYFTYSGIRQIKVTSDGRLALNGRLLNLRGVSLHEQAQCCGSALDPTQIGQLMDWVRGLGATIIRAHYPLGPIMEELADKDGVLLWSEVPVYQVHAAYLNNPGWTASAHALLESNILENQNHPSILLWSIGNELATPATHSEIAYIRGAAALAHQLDPTRPVGMAVMDWPGVPCQTAYAPLNVIGVNEYFGVFDAGGGATDDRDSLSPFLDNVRACYPHQAIFVTEFGFEGQRDGPVEERGTYANQINNLVFHTAVFATKPWLSGAIWFAMQDFAARPGWEGGDPRGNPPFVQKGVVDLSGNEKQSYAVMRSIYTSTVQVGPPGSARDGSRRHSHRRTARPARFGHRGSA